MNNYDCDAAVAAEAAGVTVAPALWSWWMKMKRLGFYIANEWSNQYFKILRNKQISDFLN